MIKSIAKLFINKSEETKLDEMERLLIEKGFVETIVEGKSINGKRCKTAYFSKEGEENIFALTVNTKGICLPIIMPMTLAKKFYMKNGKFNKTIRIKSHSNKNRKYSPVIEYGDKSNMYLHRILLKESGYIVGRYEVDHICGHHGVIVENELRVCNSGLNKLNMRNTRKQMDSEFSYNKYHDFRDSFWIPFLHYVLGIISYEDMHTLRAMELDNN